ncbi:MAG: hypothetical protein EHM39_02940, partial [Chloroflexi bacterium]
MNQTPTIVLLTDFGLSDTYVGTMKGVILSICPAARLIDLTHAVEPQHIRQAAYLLLTAYRYFPPHAVFLVVVDPGVGTARQPIAIETDHGVYVAPDNGVLSYVLSQVQPCQQVILQNPAYRLPSASQTFHGRDIFSPAAAHLANGVLITDLGPAIPQIAMLPEPLLEIGALGVRGEVLHIDHYGNVITSIGRLMWTSADFLHFQPQFGRDHGVYPPIFATRCRVTVGGQTISGIHRTYGDVPPGTLVALIGSAGQLEIGFNQGSAAEYLNVSVGDPVT